MEVSGRDEVVVNAFSFLQKKLAARGEECSNIRFALKPGMRVADIIAALGLERDDVEGVFINGTIHPLETLLAPGDRVGLVPPGTPGPYRYLLGICDKEHTTGSTL